MKNLYNFDLIRGVLIGFATYKLIDFAYNTVTFFISWKRYNLSLRNLDDIFVIGVGLAIAVAIALFFLLKNPTHYIRPIATIFIVVACLYVLLLIYGTFTLHLIHPPIESFVRGLLSANTVISLLSAYLAYLLYKITRQPQTP